MRVIGGKARGHKLRRVPGDTTRPIMDRVKENLFNILGNWVIDTIWLDLFAGTGQVGIEALSRGAAQVVFVDLQPIAVKTVRQNLKSTRLENNAVVVQGDAFEYLRRKIEVPFDVIYVAPPQYHGIWIEALSEIDGKASRWLSDEGMIIVQIDPAEFEDRAWRSLRAFDRRRYGRTMLCFYELVTALRG